MNTRTDRQFVYLYEFIIDSYKYTNWSIIRINIRTEDSQNNSPNIEIRDIKHSFIKQIFSIKMQHE